MYLSLQRSLVAAEATKSFFIEVVMLTYSVEGRVLLFTFRYSWLLWVKWFLLFTNSVGLSTKEFPLAFIISFYYLFAASVGNLNLAVFLPMELTKTSKFTSEFLPVVLEKLDFLLGIDYDASFEAVPFPAAFAAAARSIYTVEF